MNSTTKIGFANAAVAIAANFGLVGKATEVTERRISVEGVASYANVKALITNVTGVRPIVAPDQEPSAQGPLLTFCLPEGFVYLQSVYNKPGCLSVAFVKYESNFESVLSRALADFA